MKNHEGMIGILNWQKRLLPFEKAKEYTANWNAMKKNHIGFLLWGPIGTGKSYIAGCIANALLNREITVKMTNFNTIIDDMFPLEDKTEYINALARYELLILVILAQNEVLSMLLELYSV